MFKPSLKRSILNDKLCLPTERSQNPFQISQHQSKTINIPKLNTHISKTLNNNNIPSIMVPQQLLIKKQFSNAKHYTHIFTPLSYDFKAYPLTVKQIISLNPSAAQAGKITNLINFIMYQKYLVLWKDQNINLKQQQQIKIHKFAQNIDILQSNIIKNVRIFKHQPVIVIAIVFKNKITLFKLDQKQLKLQDLMIKYKLKSCRNIHKVIFTQKNQVIFSGDHGQLSILSFMKTGQKSKQKVITLKSPILKKYFSSSSFDYSTQFIIRQISVNSIDQNFIYVLTDSIKRSSYFMYCLKHTVNKIIKLKEQPKYVHKQTFIDIYKFKNQKRNELLHVQRIKEKDVQKKVKESYNSFSSGEGVVDGFQIMAIHAKSNNKASMTLNQFIIDKSRQMKNQSLLQNQQDVPKILNPYYLSPQIQLFTKCGYIIKLIHITQTITQKQSSRQQKFSFLSQPQKIPSTLYGQASLLQSKNFSSSIISAQFSSLHPKKRSNYLIHSLGYQNLSIMNNMLTFYGKQKLCFLKIQDLKKGVYEDKNNIQYLRENQMYYMELEDYQQKYQKKYQILVQREREIISEQRQNLLMERDGFDCLNDNNYIKNINRKGQNQYIKLFNNQRKWTVFDNQGQSNIYLFQLRHLILTYLHFKLQFHHPISQFSLNFDSYQSIFSQLSTDIRFHSIIQKIIRIYGRTQFICSLIQILMINTKQQHQYFYVQKQFIDQIVRKQFDYQMGIKFDQWSYKLQAKQGEKIVATEKIIKFVWILLFQYQYKNLLITEHYQEKTVKTEYFQKKKQFQHVQNKLSYSAYGYALQLMFFKIIQPIIYFKAKQFKQKSKILIKCQQNLIKFLQFIQNKKIKSQNHEFLSQFKQYLHQSYKKPNIPSISSSLNKKLMNTTSSTNCSQDTLYFQSQQMQQPTKRTQIHTQPSQILQKSISSCISKIILVINVMGILSQKDSRENLPNFIQILTNIKNQIKIGDLFFKQELLINQKSNAAEIIHLELVKQVQNQLPEFKIKNKIDYLKFKISRNILNIKTNTNTNYYTNGNNNNSNTNNYNNNQMSQADLKIINMKRLADIITSVDISELRQIFIGKNTKLDYKKYYSYIQFLTACMCKCIKQIRQLSQFKQQKLTTLSSLKNSSPYSHLSTLSIQKLLISIQYLQYNQQQLLQYYTQIKHIFTKILQQLKLLTGQQYYQTEKYLNFIIQLLVENFGYEDVLIQFMEIEIKRLGFIEKLNQIKKIVEAKYYKNKQFKPLLNIQKDKQQVINQNSTFKYFLKQQHKLSFNNNTTLDTNN